MNPNTMQATMDQVMIYLPQLAIAVIILMVATYAAQRGLRKTTWARFAYFTHLGFCLVVGWMLILASARFNFVYTLAFSGSAFLAYCAVGVNIAGGIALHSAASAYVKGNKKRAVFFAVLYTPILLYSLLAANSTLLTGDATTRQMADANVSQRAAYAAMIKAKQMESRAIRSTSTATRTTGIPSSVRNSNGTSVSMATHCRAGNWYAKNRSTCRDYLAAVSASGATAALAGNQAEQATLLQQIAANKLSAPVPQQSAFFGVDVAPRFATLALALVMELAAITVLLHVALELGTPPPKNSGRNRTEPPKTAGTAPDRTNGRTGQTSGTAGRGAGGSTVKQVHDDDGKSAVASYYKGGKLATDEVFRGVKPAEVSDDQIYGYLYQMAMHNPHKPAISNRLIDNMREHLGVGVGKTRLCTLMARADDTILVTDRGGNKSYTFKDLNHVQENTRATAGGAKSLSNG